MCSMFPKSWANWHLQSGLIALFALLSACTQAPTKPNIVSPNHAEQHLLSIQNIQAFSLKGRIAVQTEGQGFSGKINWQHTTKTDVINLFSPFGGQVAKINKTPQSVTLTDNKGNRITEGDMNGLMQKHFGWVLPVLALEDWALGRIKLGEHTANEPTFDEKGRLQSFSQDGWAVRYKRYIQTSGYDLPSKLTLRKDGLYLKLLIESWDI